MGYPFKSVVFNDVHQSALTGKEQRTSYLLAITFLNLLIFPLLYLFRSYDNNTLVSWKWTFHSLYPGKVYLAIICITVLSFIISRVHIKRTYFPAILVVMSFSFLVPVWRLPETIIDSSRYIIQAKFIEREGIGFFLREWGGEINAWTDLPLVPFLYGLILRLFGEARIYLQILNGMFFSCAVLFTYLLGKELWDEERGFHAGLLLMGIPYLVVQVPLVMVDVATMFFMTAALYFYIKAVREGGIVRILVASIVIVLAMLTKFSVWLMLLVLPAVTLANACYFDKHSRKRSVRIFVSAGILVSVILAMKHQTIVSQINILSSFQLPALKKWGEGYLSTFFFQSHPFLCLLSIIGMYTALRKKDRTFLVPGWFFVFMILFQVHRMRYIIPLMPLFTLAASYGLSSIRLRDIRRYTVMGIAGLSLVIVYAGYYPFLQKTSMANLQNAARYINKEQYRSVRAITLPQMISSGNTEMTVPLLDLYTQADIVHEKKPVPVLPDTITQKTPLRFTWEYGLPAMYYNDVSRRTDSTVVIAGGRLDDAILKNILSLKDNDLGAVQRFESLSGIFRYRALVYVIKNKPLSGSGH